MKLKLTHHKLSVIVPAHRQARTIVKDINRIEAVLAQIRYPYEIIVVVDGYGDGTYRAAKKIISANVKVTVYMKNQGKGHAVRLGMSKAAGDYIAFIDSGMEIDPNSISILLEHLEWYNADIIVGSKRHPASIVCYPSIRKILSFCYQMIVWFLFHLKIRDTQTGIKIFKRKVLGKILPRLLVKQYAFDLEMLAVAQHLGFERIYEAPIKLKYNFTDLIHASTFRTIYHILIDTLAIFYRIYILRYYDDENWKRKG
ncbi:glycosyltransferase [Candidatus Gottesmanbacteria bacterium]|nr:glycosyltransferase [Candidatus Gottesmanbacteria bacterium]